MRFLLLPAAIALLWAVADAEASQVQIGTQHFADGTFPTLSDYFTAVAGQPAPFDTFQGSDNRASANFSASFNFAYAAQVVNSASFTLGIYDHDSAAPGDQVGSFTINGFDLTSTLNSAFNSRGGTQAEYNVYTITLPTTVLASLATGSASVTLALASPGLQGLPGTSDSTSVGNGAGLDFAVLDLNPTVVPEPGTIALAASGLPVGLGLWLKRRRKNAAA